MDKNIKCEDALRERLGALEAENERLCQIVRQLNATLQKLIDACILPED